MTSISPISINSFDLNFPTKPDPTYNLMGRFVKWLRSTKEPMVYHSLIMTVTVVTSTILMCTVVFCPLVIWGIKEAIHQQEQVQHKHEIKKLQEIANDGAQIYFIQGRIQPIKLMNIELSEEHRSLITEKYPDLKKKGHLTDQDLVCAYAIKNTNYMVELGLVSL